ncbi:2Fe-2S iron-sulfur cluster-binding protein [Litorimonas sp. RW-G-Af-16]|uniref:2Fe-2S iron-sulfur cluster-binding protein n=1 Tax=Litorimonas sp. RW-G-Af-16 TaxID=3241168 RepID=UPI00390C79C0
MSLIDTTQSINFTFDGKAYQGFEGDTLASALLRNKVRVVARSFKYHRPRGIFGAGSEEPNALVEIHGGGAVEPNRRATTIKLFEGLDARSQNYMGSVNRDFLAINDLLSPFLAAGFYYKTFMWPKAFWEKLYEPIIRRAAGLGSLSHTHDPDRYDKGFLHSDILIIGAGPAGLFAALNAGRAGKRVILADEDFRMGGRLLSDKNEINSASGLEWLETTLAELRTLPNVRLLPRTTIYGMYDHGIYGGLETKTDEIGTKSPRQILWRIYAAHSILAAGATERPIAFANNDRPGIMLASALRTYQNRFGINFDTAAILANHDEAFTTHNTYQIDIRKGQWVVDTKGRHGLKSIKLNTGETHHIHHLGLSGGWNPNVHLTCHKRGRPRWNEALACFVPDAQNLPSDMTVIGAANGSFSTHGAFTDAQAACQTLDISCDTVPATEDAPFTIKPFYHVKGKNRAWVDFQNDVTAKDITLAHQEGFSSVEHVKRYTTLGMATDQGKTSNVVGLAVLAEATHQTIPQTGTTIFRPPYTPIPIGAFAGAHRGQHFKPTRLTPSHQYATENGATFVDTGYWKRAQWFARKGEQGWRDSVDREVLMTRSSVGICDVTTLGKIDVQGRDAGEFLNKVYANTFSTLAVGKCRYGLMLREDGIAMDDGTTARFSDTHYVMTTTTAKAGPVFRHLEFVRQCLTPDLDVHLISTTDQWAQFSVAGPNARKLLQKIVDPKFDISNDAFPYMACGEVTVCGGTRARLFRLSFSGELAYEISVPARYGDALIRELMAQGEEFEAIMYGTEALGVMRIEKGHAAGNELNGTTTALNLGLGGFVAKKKDCIGKVLSQRTGLLGDDVYHMVGFVAEDAAEALHNGAHFVNSGEVATPDNDQGYMSSVAWSPMLERYIGLGFLKNGKARMGDTLHAKDMLRGHDVKVTVVSPHFFDPEGGRLRV